MSPLTYALGELASLPPAKRQEAIDWLRRELGKAMLCFIAKAKVGDGLLCCFNEFRYMQVPEALAGAMVNASTDKHGKFHECFQHDDNLRTIKAVKFPKDGGRP